ncbi:hypothetical protein NPIL_375551 [Nephila pilipes]|uniref:Uncharacterized protein n=1 Tax=Nephila pilipes TaxID=299642 RepID=A0A8X6T502_NEPPI|nr:hypothetical protein NPIL_375551 [Nephila pilipes]
MDRSADVSGCGSRPAATVISQHVAGSIRGLTSHIKRDIFPPPPLSSPSGFFPSPLPKWHTKSLVYDNHFDNAEDLIERIAVSAGEIRETPSRMSGLSCSEDVRLTSQHMIDNLNISLDLHVVDHVTFVVVH